MTPTIDHEKQNRPSLIAADLELLGIPRSLTHHILLRRGVYKWFAVRRKIIKLKNLWKEDITSIQEQIRRTKRSRNRERLAYLKGYLKAREEDRAAVRELCHSSRLQAPDNDREAQEFLQKVLAGEFSLLLEGGSDDVWWSAPLQPQAENSANLDPVRASQG